MRSCLNFTLLGVFQFIDVFNAFLFEHTVFHPAETVTQHIVPTWFNITLLQWGNLLWTKSLKKVWCFSKLFAMALPQRWDQIRPIVKENTSHGMIPLVEPTCWWGIFSWLRSKANSRAFCPLSRNLITIKKHERKHASDCINSHLDAEWNGCTKELIERNALMSFWSFLDSSVFGAAFLVFWGRDPVFAFFASSTFLMSAIC